MNPLSEAEYCLGDCFNDHIADKSPENIEATLVEQEVITQGI